MCTYMSIIHTSWLIQSGLGSWKYTREFVSQFKRVVLLMTTGCMASGLSGLLPMAKVP